MQLDIDRVLANVPSGLASGQGWLDPIPAGAKPALAQRIPGARRLEEQSQDLEKLPPDMIRGWQREQQSSPKARLVAASLPPCQIAEP
jgi:hypothetical protein